tara:strand:+ start:5042 stop:6766 length:1725 start_codon:yes stop_codon:yes gene_type:complete
MTWKISNVPVNLSIEGDGTTSFPQTWSNQDIAIPGSQVGDGVADIGEMPLRFIIKPENEATETVDMEEFFCELQYTTQDLEALNNSTNISTPITIYDSVNPNVTEYLSANDSIYPGFNTQGNEVYARTWQDGIPSTLNGVTDNDGNSIPVTITLPFWCLKITIYNYNFTTNSGTSGGTVGNSGVVLAWVNPEYDLTTHELFFGGSESSLGSISYLFKVAIAGPAQPIGEELDDTEVLNDDDISTEASNSFNITLQVGGQYGMNSFIQGQSSGVAVIPYITQPLLEIGSGSPYSYSTQWSDSNPHTGTITFTPTNAWTEQSLAIPESYQATGLISFIIIPYNGYYLSRHNLNIQTTGGSSVDYDLGQIGTFSTSSNEEASGAGFPLPYNSIWTSGTQQEYYGFYNNLAPGLGQQFQFQQVTNSPYDSNTTTSLRGATKWSNVQVSYGTSSVLLSQLLPITDEAVTADIQLTDTKQYTAGLPVLGQLVNSIPNSQQAFANFIANDTGAEYVNGIMPGQYCPSDWAGNAVVVNLRWLANLVGGANAQNITISIDGGATVDDGSQCVSFSNNLIGGSD